MSWISSSPGIKRGLKFLLGGGINTAVTYGVYLSLLVLLPYQWAYLIAYALGVVFAYWFNAMFVFKVQLTWRGLFSYPLVYVVQYAVSALLLGTLVEFVQISKIYSPLLVAIIVLPLTYAISRSVLNWSNNPK
ncbi:MAG: GtrA family protein [bacterium]|nr:GtrA family protein [Gammaproteobacteria bacterium]